MRNSYDPIFLLQTGNNFKQHFSNSPSKKIKLDQTELINYPKKEIDCTPQVILTSSIWQAH